MSDSFFDMPAGFRDADLEMAELENLGRRAAKRYKGFTFEDRAALTAGEHLTVVRWFGETERRSYTAIVRSVDADEIGPILEYSLDCRHWHPTARAARLDWSGRTGATVPEAS